LFGLKKSHFCADSKENLLQFAKQKARSQKKGKKKEQLTGPELTFFLFILLLFF